MSELKSRPPSRTTLDLDSFLSGAEEKTKTPKAKEKLQSEPKRKITYPWEDERVRGDINKVYNLRLSEPYLLKLRYISENTPQSMQKFCINVIEREIDKKIKELEK